MWPEDGGAGSRTRHKPHIAALILLPYRNNPLNGFVAYMGRQGAKKRLLPCWGYDGSSLLMWCFMGWAVSFSLLRHVP